MILCRYSGLFWAGQWYHSYRNLRVLNVPVSFRVNYFLSQISTLLSLLGHSISIQNVMFSELHETWYIYEEWYLRKKFGFVNNNFMVSEIEKCRYSPLLETGCC